MFCKHKMQSIIACMLDLKANLDSQIWCILLLIGFLLYLFLRVHCEFILAYMTSNSVVVVSFHFSSFHFLLCRHADAVET